MKYLSIFTPAARPATGQPNGESMAEMGKFIEESMKSGKLVTTGGLLPVSQGGALIKRHGDQITVTDGPFIESKEMIAGFAIIQAQSKDDAIQMTRDFMKIAGDGQCDLRQLMDPAEAARQ